ncbi:DUF3039 domain-containing protein [Blastococcus sp. Marseille-P5729]|uniref:DUF3039 domain-containing protein n=1 Tax=Blastococcus sp. Marseille-P5729 TaxID=2086582 RepID=UPI00131BF5DA|nr:DUF3039 domain-containing protein [Blastococcus sp. Marseille-P5729]
MLREDLTSDWESPHVQRRLAEGAERELGALSELPHPLVAKACEVFGVDEREDLPAKRVKESRVYQLWRIRAGQWRGGVWRDPDTGVRWLLIAGLGKGDHEDHDDVYEIVGRAQGTGEAERWLPTDEDHRLLKAETASRLSTEWELRVQRRVGEALQTVQDGGEASFTIEHPLADRFAAHERTIAAVTMTVTPVREDGYHADEISVDVEPTSRWASSALLWQLQIRVLISISPPEQDWDYDGQTFSNIGEPGSWRQRSEILQRMIADGELGESVPGTHSHYAHRLHLAGKTIEGRGVRGLCGVFFVPGQDHEALPMCPRCNDEFAQLPG